ncbi:chromosome condensation protein CrcB [Halostella sp. JP-L12]|uniref:fluoride efflux transporter FluC n=1 Tax=Halostella TaxID=1843185 RepID=UPI000EF7D67C|nr:MULTISPECIES: CrcB family protein [Halostella]NHN49688.1 chromosome condensation protein CrcB [Halostella sp. JP-L12]
MTESQSLTMVESAVLIALGGFAGANVRYAADLVLPALSATLAANVAGSALLGFVLYEEALVGAFSRQLRVALGTGFLSSLTTYSTFAVQTAAASPAVAALNVVGNYALGFLGVALGRWAALRLAAEVRA